MKEKHIRARLAMAFACFCVYIIPYTRAPRNTKTKNKIPLLNGRPIELTKKIDSHAVKLENIEKWKNGIFSITKWTAATVAGATITILFKILYDVMSK